MNWDESTADLVADGDLAGLDDTQLRVQRELRENLRAKLYLSIRAIEGIFSDREAERRRAIRNR